MQISIRSDKRGERARSKRALSTRAFGKFNSVFSGTRTVSIRGRSRVILSSIKEGRECSPFKSDARSLYEIKWGYKESDFDEFGNVVRVSS